MEIGIKESYIKDIDGSITAPKGFKATGAHIGLKKKKKDLMIIVSDFPATTAGVFTTNLVKAAPVLWNQKAVHNKILGVVVNSGNANACTGELGVKHTEIMAETLASCINASKEQIIVSSTGVIGVPLPIEKIVDGIKSTVGTVDFTREGAKRASEGIMTTDTYSKEIAIEVEIGGTPVRIAGIAKGSGMIHPNMATMLSFVTTDADISREMLDKALKESSDETYNMISVDGDTSTNDMVVVLANGAAKNNPITSENEDYTRFKEGLDYVNRYLSKLIVNDGEGVTKVLEVVTTGAATKEDARKISKSVICSNLVKTAFFGEDANWGRILCAAGYSGANFNPDKASISFSSLGGEISLFVNGEPLKFDEDKALQILKERKIRILISLNDGNAEATAWGCDLSYEYVKINGEYRT
jgi:glutamate N-acetyltransferase/amino-acid N-acetyltransferase